MTHRSGICSSEALLELEKGQIIAFWSAVSVVAVGESMGGAGRGEASTFVPSNDLIAQMDRHQSHGGCTPEIDRRLLGRSKNLISDARTLEFRSHGEHPEVRDIGVMLCRQFAATDELVCFGEQHDCAGPFEQVNEHRSVDALTVDKIGFGRPPGATAVAAICRLHEIDHCRHVFGGRVAEGELGHRPGLRMVLIEVSA
jgi:hypothetical protein